MALGIKRLEECTLEIEALASNRWYIKFLGTEKVEHTTTVTVENGNIVAYKSSINNFRMNNGKLEPANRIKEENQEQRVIEEISKIITQVIPKAPFT